MKPSAYRQGRKPQDAPDQSEIEAAEQAKQFSEIQIAEWKKHPVTIQLFNYLVAEQSKSLKQAMNAAQISDRDMCQVASLKAKEIEEILNAYENSTFAK